MLITESGIITPIKLMQSSNALFPISVTELGILMFVKRQHPSNELSPILVTKP